jgi:glycosyltransferase involved in cell wall biosynthesis
MSAGKTRLCIVTPHQQAGGAEYQIACLIDVLAQLHRFEIFYLARHLSAQPQSSAYQVVRIGRGGRMPRFGYIMDAMPLYRALRRIAPHSLYQRVACGYTGVCAWYARRHGARLTWHVASDSDVSRRDLVAGRNPLRSVLERRSVEFGIRHANHVVAQTLRQAELLQENYARKVDLIIPNFHPLPEETVDKRLPISVIWVANFKPLKQPEVFVRLTAKLRDLKGVRFIMVGAPATGSGDRQWSEALMASIRDTPNLEYLGQKTQREVNELLARAHVYVNTSAFEGFANTFIQAWMRDVAVVSLHVNPDGVLDHESVGIHAGSEDQLTLAVRSLIDEPALRADYAARGRRYATQSHSMKNAHRLVQLIDAGTVDREGT